MERLKGKIAIVTGAARSLGESHARILESLGAKVVLTDLDDEQGNKVAAAIGGNALFVRHDVTSRTDWAHVIASAENTFGPVNVLVNNAGIAPLTSFEALDEAVYDKVMAVNATGTRLGMQAVVPSMRKAQCGSIINTSSIGGQRGTYQFEYCVSKWAVTGMTKAAALSLIGHGIRVNSIHPGVIDTDLVRRNDDSKRPQPLSEMLKKIPAGRLGRVEEVSYLVAYLASDESTFCTGAEFVVDGGQTCRP